MDPTLFLAVVLLFLYGLVSAALERTPITAPMVFVGAGMAVGPLGLGLASGEVDSHAVELIAQVALATVLFADASALDLRALRQEFRIPLRLLAIGLPLTALAGFAAALLVLGDFNPWLLVAVSLMLAPTDAVLGLAVVDDHRVPRLLRDSIAVESGLNDGIALPALLFSMAALAAAGAAAPEGFGIAHAVKQLLLGPLAGIAVGYAGGAMMDRAIGRGWMEPLYQRLSAVVLALIAYMLAEYIGGNGFIAAFAGGLVLGTRSEDVRARMQEFAEAEGRALAMLVFLVFGAALVPAALPHWDFRSVVYAILSLTVVRMLPVALCLAGSGLGTRATLFVGWFGPRGIASVFYLLLFVRQMGHGGFEYLLGVVVLTVLMSVVLHGLSAVPLASRWSASASPGSLPEADRD